MKLTTLDALLIFLVGHKNQSGYDIRLLFQATPIGVFSDSPGSIYPSLSRLEARKLLASSASPSGRRRRSYKATALGQKALAAWLERPIETEPSKRRSGEVELRFVMIAEAIGTKEAARFLEIAEMVYVSELKDIEIFMAGPGGEMSTASQASVELGMRTIRLRIEWCRETRKKMGRRE